MAGGGAKKEETSTSKPTTPKLTIGELSKLLGITSTPIKKAMAKGDRYFADYCFERCGRRFKAVDVKKPGAKIPRWNFVED